MTTATLLRPLSDHVVVRPQEADEVSPGGVVIPESAKEKPSRGRVVAVGSGKLLESGSRATLECCEGDTVIYGKYGGTTIEVDGETLVVLRESDILLVEN